MKVKFNKTEKTKFMKAMSSWDNLSKVMYNWNENELSIAISVEMVTRKRIHILGRLAGRYNSVRAIKLDQKISNDFNMLQT